MTLLKKLWLLLLQQTLGTEESTQDIKPSSTTGTGSEGGGDTEDGSDIEDDDGIDFSEATVVPLKKAVQYNIFSPHYVRYDNYFYHSYRSTNLIPEWLRTGCEIDQCNFQGAASFDSEDNLLIPSGNVFDASGVWLGYETFTNEYLPSNPHPMASCYDISIGGVENYNVNQSWYQESDKLNQDFRLKLCPRAPLSFRGLNIISDKRTAEIDSRLSSLVGEYHFCSKQSPTANGYDQFNLFFAIGTDHERGLLYGNLAPSGLIPINDWGYPKTDEAYIYRYKNREEENRPKLYVWAITCFIGHHVDYIHTNEFDDDDMDSILPNSMYNRYCFSSRGQTPIHTYFKTKIGEFKGDYRFGGTSKRGEPVQYYFDVPDSDTFCDYKYDHGDLDLRNIEFNVTHNDLHPYNSNPAIRYTSPEAGYDAIDIDGWYSLESGIPLCNFEDISINIEGQDPSSSYDISTEGWVLGDPVVNKYQKCDDDNRYGYSFLTQKPTTFEHENDFISCKCGSMYGYVNIHSCELPSGIVGFDWFTGNQVHYSYPVSTWRTGTIVDDPLGEDDNDSLSIFQPEFNDGNHYGILSSYLLLNIEGVKPVQTSGTIENGEITVHLPPSASKTDCYSSYELNDIYELNATSNFRRSDSPNRYYLDFDEALYKTKIDPICCQCGTLSLGCVDELSVQLIASEYKYNTQGKDYYSSKLIAEIAGHTYEYDFQNLGVNIPQPVDFNNQTIEPELVDVDPSYSGVHDFSDAKIEITFGDVDNFDCMTNITRCAVFDDQIGPDNIMVTIPNDWRNGVKEEDSQWTDDIFYYYAKCGHCADEQGNGYGTCSWFYSNDDRDDLVDPLDWCTDLPYGEYILSNDTTEYGRCTWLFQGECEPTGVMPDEGQFFESQEDIDLYEATYNQSVDDLYLYSTANETAEVSENCNTISSTNYYFDPWGHSCLGEYSKRMYFDNAGLPVLCPPECMKLFIFRHELHKSYNPHWPAMPRTWRNYDNKFEVVLEISQIYGSSDKSYFTDYDNTGKELHLSTPCKDFSHSVRFKAIIESAPGSKILDSHGRPLFRYYITKEMLDGLVLEYDSQADAPVMWNNQSVTLNLVD